MDRTKISGTQFMFTVACFLQSSVLLTSFLTDITYHESWLTVVAGGILSLPVILVYNALIKRFPTKNLLQMLTQVHGPVVGKVLGALYVWFFLTLASLNLNDMGNFAKITIMTEAPQSALLILCMLAAALAVWYGVGVATRYSVAFVVTEVLIIIFTTLMSMNLIDLNNFLPMFDLTVMDYVQSLHIILTIPFGELVVMLMIVPNVESTVQKKAKYLLGGVGIGAVSLLAVVMRDIGVLGNTLSLFTLPGLITMRMISFAEVFSRLEILFAIALVMLLFFKITLLYYVAVVAVAQLFEVEKHRPLVLAAGMLITIYSTFLYPDPIQQVVSAHSAVPFIWMVFQILIPLLTLVIAKLRKVPQSGEVSP